MNLPLLVLALSFVFLFLAAHLGDLLRDRVFPLKEGVRNDFGIVLSATLTLLGLLIGFSFSMAVSRYDLRRTRQSLAISFGSTKGIQQNVTGSSGVAVF